MLWRSLDRLHRAVKDCARIGFQESSPTTNASHAAVWNYLNEAQKDAALKLDAYSKLSGDSSAPDVPRCNCVEGECHGPDVAQAYGHLCKAECPVEAQSVSIDRSVTPALAEYGVAREVFNSYFGHPPETYSDDQWISAYALALTHAREKSVHETTLHDPLRSFAEWAAGASCDDEYAPRMMRHLAALAKDALRGDAATPPPVIIGWAVGDLHGAPAMYNINERERAFDAAKRWDKPITGLIQAPGTPEFTQETSTEPPEKRCCCGEWALPHGWVTLETATHMHRREHPCFQKVAEKASACACRCHSSSGPNEDACIYCGHSPVNGKGD